MEYKRLNSQLYKAGDIITVGGELYIVTDSTVAEMDLEGTNLLIVNLDNGYLSVLPEVKQVEKVNTEINIINW